MTFVSFLRPANNSSHCHKRLPLYSVEKMLFLTVVWFVFIIRFAMLDSVLSDGHHRVRRFTMTKNSKLSFDFNFLMPVPVMGSMDVLGIIEVPVSVAVTNDTFDWTPISLPYFVMSAPPPALPLPMFPKVFHDPEEAVKYLSHHNHYVHQVVKRHTRRVSFQHRKDILTTVIDSLEEFGVDGGSCIHRYICQLAHSPLLIESPFHEIIHHIFS